MTERELFVAALHLSGTARLAFLEQACGDDSPLRERIESLLHEYERLGSFLEPAAAGGDATASFPAGPEPDPEVTTDLPGENLGTVVAGKYKLIERIGEGGMGTVWMAQQSEPVKRFVAVKLIKTGMDSKGVLARFEAERQALAVMDHPNIAKILDGGVTETGAPFFVMELVKGVPITEFCDARKLTPKQRLELFVPVCQAIQHAHQKGIIHRDIKPSNVLIALYDDKPVPKVIDFGIAKATGQALTDNSYHTAFGGIVGTPEYMSPEQANLNNLDVDTRSDVYSLGVLLYELLAGSPPFRSADLKKAGMLEMLRVVREEEPPKPSTKLSTANALPSISANRGTEPKKLTGLLRNELDWIVMKALEKDRARRYESANGFAADVLRYLTGEAVQAHPPSAGYRLRKFVRRHKGRVAATAAFLMLLLAAVGVSSLLAVQAKRAEAMAEEKRIEAEANATEAKANAALANANEDTWAKVYGQFHEAVVSAEIRSLGLQIDLDLAELRANSRIGLLRLARPLKEKVTYHTFSPPNFTTTNVISLGGNPQFIELKEFVTAAVLTTGQNYAPLLPPITHDGHAVVRTESSPDFKTLLTLGVDGTARLWDMRTTRPIAILRQGEGDQRVVDCGFSPDGRTVYTDDQVNVARFWDTPGGTLRGTLRVDTDCRPKGYALPRSDMNTRRTLHVGDSRALTSIFADEPGEGDNPFVPGSKWSSLNVHKSAVELWDTTTSRLIARLDGPDRNINKFDFLGGGRWVTTETGPSTVLIFSADDGRLLAHLEHPGEVVTGVAASPSGRRMATISYSQRRDRAQYFLRTWDTTTWKSESGAAPHELGEWRMVVMPGPIRGPGAIKFLTDELITVQSDPVLNSNVEIYRSHQAKPLTKGSFSSPSLNLLLPEGKVLRLANGRVYDTEDWKRMIPPAGRQYHPELIRFALDGRFVKSEYGFIDTSTEKSFPASSWSGPLGAGGQKEAPPDNLPGFGIVAAGTGYGGTPGNIYGAIYGAQVRLLPPVGRLTIPPNALELWAQVAVRGELGPDGEFVKWDEPTWEKKRQELAAIPPPHPDLPFPGYVATDKLYWLRAEYDAADDAGKLRLATALLRRAEASGDKAEAVRWRAETDRLSPQIAPPPREKQ